MSIFVFKDTSAYLRHYISQLPKKGRGESTRIARHLHVSTTLVSQVLSGHKTFTTEQTQGLIEYLGLSNVEADYFVFLNQLERAGTSELKKFWRSKLDELKVRALKLSQRLKPARVLSDQERAVFYSSPLYSAIRLYTSVGENGKSIADISERFEISRAKAADILKFLVEAGLCRAQEDRYFLGTQSTHLEQGSPHLLKHHSNWRLRALQRSEDLADDELMFTSPVSLSHADFELLRESMVEFIKDFLAKVDASPAQDIACFNMDFFWIKR